MATDVRITGRWGSVGEGLDRTTWPLPADGQTGHALRHLDLSSADRLYLASIAHAYAYLTDPSLPQYAAVAALKRARLVAREQSR